MHKKNMSKNRVALLFILSVILIVGIAYILKSDEKSDSAIEDKTIQQDTQKEITAEDSEGIDALLKEIKNTEMESEVNIENLE